MTMPAYIFTGRGEPEGDKGIPVTRWSHEEKAHPYVIRNEKLIYITRESQLLTDDTVKYYYIFSPVLPLDYINPEMLAYSYKNSWRVDSESGEKIDKVPIPLAELSNYIPFPKFAKNIAELSVYDEAKKWGIDTSVLKDYPEIQNRLDDWATGLATGASFANSSSKIDASGMPVNPKGGSTVPNPNDMANVVNRIRTFIPPANTFSGILNDTATVNKMNAVRGAWSNALQNGVMDNQEQYTSMFARTLFENLLPQEDMDTGDFKKIMNLASTPQGFNNFIQTVNNATSKVDQMGTVSEFDRQQKIQGLVSTNIRQRLGVEQQSQIYVPDANVASPDSNVTKSSQGTSQPSMKTVVPSAESRMQNNLYSNDAKGDLLRQIDLATKMGIDTSEYQNLYNQFSEVTDAGVQTAGQLPIGGRMMTINDAKYDLAMKQVEARRNFLGSQNKWFVEQFPEQYKQWQDNLTKQLGIKDTSQYSNNFIYSIMDSSTGVIGNQNPTDSEGNLNAYYLKDFNPDVVKNKLGSAAIKWLQEGRLQQNITVSPFAVPGAVTQDIERTTKYNELKVQADQEAYQYRNRPQKVAKI